MKCKLCNNQTDNTSGICYGHGMVLEETNNIQQQTIGVKYNKTGWLDTAGVSGDYKNMNPYKLKSASNDAYHLRRSDGYEIAQEVQRRRDLNRT